ncbi:MAG: hypothetical protein QF773_05960 [Lentisphaeria bacterium]|jgi:hypothetical protein|nr:hypothetical protein [Lentisphaeria bacterium]
MNSLLFHAENGRLEPGSFYPCDIPAIVRVVVSVPEVEAAEIFVMAQKNDAGAAPFKVMLNGQSYELDTDVVGRVQWLRCQDVGAHVCIDANDLTALPQPGWDLAMEPASSCPLIRLRVHTDATLGRQRLPSYGDPVIEATAEEWLALLPENLRKLEKDKVWDWAWALAGFLAQAWPYSNGSLYAPWDARTLLTWGDGDTREKLEALPTMICVHYAVAFIQFATAMRLPVRAVVTTSDINDTAGHFIAEIWLEAHRNWAMIDPTLHLCFKQKDGRPLSAVELWECREKLEVMAVTGEGFSSVNEKLEAYYRDYCLTGEAYRMHGVWNRHDWIDRPELAPPAHGTTLYAETDIIWCASSDNWEELSMFPELRLPGQLDRPPAVRPRFM